MIPKRSPQQFKPPFASIPDSDALDAVFAAPGPALLYLHDPWCPINLYAMRQLDALPGPIHTIDVSTQHDLKRAVAERTGVRHQSPQAIILRDGLPIWHASHHEISGTDVFEALAAAMQSDPGDH
jgi:bacillithiol system protein YtxJ